MGRRPQTKNAQAWEALFAKYNILDRVDACGSYVITADQIREFREPRLMAKFDHHINLPDIFADNRLAILPISRYSYVIARFEAYKAFETMDTGLHQVTLPSYLQSLNRVNIPSEAIALNCALVSGILEDFLEDTALVPTVSGQMGTDTFDFSIQTVDGGRQDVSVASSQIEIDAALEGVNYLSLIEAKRDISKDFLIRQLYYPYRVWSCRVTKKVKLVFLVYSNGIFSLYEYEFRDPAVYNSLVLVKHKNYTIEDTAIGMRDLLDVLDSTPLLPEPALPFPQADRFARIVNLCELLASGDLTREEVTEEYAFDIRQTNYYTDAGRYLGLIDRAYGPGVKPVYRLNPGGRQIMNLPFKQRQLAFCRAILSHRAFAKTFRLWAARGEIPDRATVVQIMKTCGLHRVQSEETYYRRASTVIGWLNWIFGRQHFADG